MLMPRWLDSFLESAWYDKLFWLFFFATFAFIAAVWIWMSFDEIASKLQRPRKNRARARSGGGGIVAGDSVALAASTESPSFEASAESGSSDSGSSDSGGGGDFSGGGGESGGGGSTGGW